MIISVMFEFLEYSLEHQLPNFSECWWDHVGAAGKAQPGWARAVISGPVVNSSPFLTQWIMDVLICNGLGIYCGMKTLEWLSLKTYKWQGLWNIPTYKYILGVIEGNHKALGPQGQGLATWEGGKQDIRVVESRLFSSVSLPGLLLLRGYGPDLSISHTA